MQELIASLKAYFSAKGEELNDDVLEGTIAGWQAGKGQLPAELVNGSDLWKPVADAYFAANGSSTPESVEVPLVEVPSGEEVPPTTQE